MRRLDFAVTVLLVMPRGPPEALAVPLRLLVTNGKSFDSDRYCIVILACGGLMEEVFTFRILICQEVKHSPSWLKPDALNDKSRYRNEVNEGDGNGR